MNWFKKSETPYGQSKEFLEKQQRIDLLLVVTKLLEPGVDISADTKKEANKRIDKILEELK